MWRANTNIFVQWYLLSAEFAPGGANRATSSLIDISRWVLVSGVGLNPATRLLIRTVSLSERPPVLILEPEHTGG